MKETSLCNNDVCNILQNASSYRNSWRGHSGITGEYVYSDHVRILKDELTHFQQYVKDVYENIQLIRPVEIKYKNSKFINTIELLVGSNSMFKKDTLIGEALDEDKLYIRMLDTNEVFELPPLVLLKNTPPTVKNACYFYNRVDGGNSKYISYHFEGQSDDYEHGETAYSLIKRVLGSNE